jgi:plastocyanin
MSRTLLTPSRTILAAIVVAAALLLTLFLSLSAGGGTATVNANATVNAKPKPHGKPAPFGSVEFEISETLFAQTTPVKEAPIPKTDPAKISDGYACEGCKQGAKEFSVEQDVFMPSQIVVHQGDTVALRIFDVEGHHVITLYDPTGATLFSKFKTYAGNEYLKVFKANQLGYYRLDCETHDPTMRMLILVLRKGA